jgi:hypothetical protein
VNILADSSREVRPDCAASRTKLSMTFRRIVPGIVLTCIVGAYIVSIVRLHPTNFFGFSEDDAIFLSSAKALAEGKGYILPSIPSNPPATRYPILYPLILSGVWRWNPSFPANLRDAIAVTVAFGVVYIGVIFAYLKQEVGISDSEALFLTGLCALHPAVVYLSANVLSDIPFAALALAAVVTADSSIRVEGKTGTTALSGLLAGFSVMMRVLGVPIVAGIILAGLVRRAWRQLLIFCGCIAPFALALAADTIVRRLAAPPMLASPGASFGWSRTWAWYTTYGNVWKSSVVNLHVLWEMLRFNASRITFGPAEYFITPAFPRNVFGREALIGIVMFAIVAGTVRQVRARGWQPIHFSLLFSMLPILVWPYPIIGRFLIPFLPLFAASIWLEGKHVLAMTRDTLLAGGSRQERLVAFALSTFAISLGFAIAGNVAAARKPIAQLSAGRALLRIQKEEVYRWLAINAPANSFVVAWEDASVYLYTGRKAMRPFVFTVAEFYEPERLPDALTHIADVARTIRADYWISASDDFGVEWPEAARAGRARLADLRGVLPTASVSTDGRVRVYRLECLQHPDVSACAAAVAVLIPKQDAQSVSTPGRARSPVAATSVTKP